MKPRKGGRQELGSTQPPLTFRLVQVLRALAALMVVAHHATIMLFERDHLPSPNWIAGSSGVDIFFVISGFVMTISSAPLRFAKHPARTFLVRRLERIVPLYWLVTTAKVLALLLAPAMALNALGSVSHVLASYAFFPMLNAEGRFEPVVVVGWTLNFEMAFYLLYTLALALRWRPVWLLTPLFLVLPMLPVSWVLHLPRDTWFYLSTVLWEFLFGMLLGLAVKRVQRLPPWMGWVALLGGLPFLLANNAPGTSFWRGLQWGLPALAVVAAAVILERGLGARSPRWTLELGDASYSIYLIHAFTLPALAPLVLLWPDAWGVHWPAEVLGAVVAVVALSALAGVGTYRLVERPIMLWFKGRRRTALPANV